MRKKIILGSIVVVNLLSVAFASNTTVVAQIIKQPVATASGHPQTTNNSPNYYADMWYRDSAEHNAIYREIYLLAEQTIKQQVAAQNLKPKQWGVILDIDETVLDTSLWNYQHDIQGKQLEWNDFAALSKFTSAPGAKAFINDIHQMGGYVNLISNRPATLEAATEKNLKKQGIYFD